MKHFRSKSKLLSTYLLYNVLSMLLTVFIFFICKYALAWYAVVIWGPVMLGVFKFLWDYFGWDFEITCRGIFKYITVIRPLLLMFLALLMGFWMHA